MKSDPSTDTINLPRWHRLLAVAAGLSLIPLTPARAANTILHNFIGGAADGSTSLGSLTLSGATLYGMTFLGGSSGTGTVFSMNTDGSGFSLLHSFTGGVADGSTPYGSLTRSGATLYGMTYRGGSGNTGTLFRMNTDGTGFGVLKSFTSAPADGANPYYGNLTLSADSSTLYGMTPDGGSSNLGTLFRMNADGSGFSLLHSFTGGGGDGRNPTGSLTLSGSTLYGMTYQGGGSNRGTLFRMNADGSGFSLLHTFTGGTADGSTPYGSLTLSGTTLYGMTNRGGSSGTGTLFRMNADGSGFSLLHSFTGGTGDGSFPYGSLTLSGSTLYGMTNGGGSSNDGTLFRINTDGTGYGVLESFIGAPADGASPLYGDLALSADALTLYGMTFQGGSANLGVVFSHPVPEPASAALLGLGALGGLTLRRRRTAAASAV